MDYDFLKNYAVEHLTELLDREQLNRYDNLFDQGEEFSIKLGSRRQRAMVIDQIFAAGSVPELQLIDKSVIY